ARAVLGHTRLRRAAAARAARRGVRGDRRGDAAGPGARAVAVAARAVAGQGGRARRGAAGVPAGAAARRRGVPGDARADGARRVGGGRVRPHPPAVGDRRAPARHAQHPRVAPPGAPRRRADPGGDPRRAHGDRRDDHADGPPA
ncbi:MAG: Methionyl-tRNA formyltransferase, partial [uncultured Gemmatimonadaceae bacterium]